MEGAEGEDGVEACDGPVHAPTRADRSSTKMLVTRHAAAPGGARAEPGIGASGRGFEGDFVPDGFELTDVVALGVAGVAVGVVVVGTEIDEVGAWLGQHVPDDDQDGSADGDDGLLLSASAGDATVAFTQGRGGPSSRDRSLTKDRGQVAVSVTGGTIALPSPRRIP